MEHSTGAAFPDEAGAAAAEAPRTRVLHLIESDGLYGAERVVLALARETRDDCRFVPVIGCIVGRRDASNALYEQALASGFEAVKLELRKRHPFMDLLRLVRSLSKHDLALIHAHGYKGTIAGYAAHLANRTPILATCHLWFGESRSSWTYRALSALEMRLYRRFRRVVAVSSPIADVLRAHGVRSDRLEVIPNGILAADWEPERNARVEELERRFKARQDSFVVLNVGRLAEQKAQGDLIEAAALLRRDHPGLQVIIVGEGSLRAVLAAKIASLSLEECVHLVGFKENVADYLAIADAFVLPSLDEGLPIALLEALAAGVPAVCTPVGGIPGLIQHEETGLIVPVASPAAIRDAIVSLIADRATACRLGEAGRAAVRAAHSAEAMYKAYRRLYLELTVKTGPQLTPGRATS